MARIEHYEFGRIVVDGQEERRDLITRCCIWSVHGSLSRNRYCGGLRYWHEARPPRTLSC
jgi:hypothetical protein